MISEGFWEVMTLGRCWFTECEASNSPAVPRKQCCECARWESEKRSVTLKDDWAPPQQTHRESGLTSGSVGAGCDTVWNAVQDSTDLKTKTKNKPQKQLIMLSAFVSLFWAIFRPSETTH